MGGRENQTPIIQLDTVPTLRVVYDDGQFLSKDAPSKEPRHPAKSNLLDLVSVMKWDITRLKVDAIVNAANRSLLGGGGVDGAIHRAAGSGLLDECRELDGCETGEAKITKGYRLPASHIIHTVGPIYDDDAPEEAAELLRACYHNCLQLTVDKNLKSVAFCSISTGVYGYPLYDATHMALDTTRRFLDSENGRNLTRVVFVTFSDLDTAVYLELLPQYFPYAERSAEEMDALTVPLPESPLPAPAELAPPAEPEHVAPAEKLPSGTTDPEDSEMQDVEERGSTHSDAKDEEGKL